VALYDARPDSPTHRQTQELFMGDNFGQKVLKIPPGVAHGCKAIGGISHLIYVTSSVYNPDEEGRIPYDDPTIGYDWHKGPAIK
jgi:dTDP-4-dehydrorhamnose 3,5-epimerase